MNIIDNGLLEAPTVGKLITEKKKMHLLKDCHLYLISSTDEAFAGKAKDVFDRLMERMDDNQLLNNYKLEVLSKDAPLDYNAKFHKAMIEDKINFILPLYTPGKIEQQQIWVAHKNGRRECLTKQTGWSTALFSNNYKYFIHTWSDLNTPTVCTLCNNKGKVLETLVENQALMDRLSAYDLGKRELFTLTTADGVELNGWMVKPADFDPMKKYPVVMYQYGGPGNQQVKNAWNIGQAGRGALLEQYLCQQGFLCVCVDNRGTGGRGAAFEKCTYLKLGQLESHDQVEAALWLGQQSYVDKNRIAIWGWSFGGFNTLMAMSEGRDVFCAGIAIAPPTSWRYYDTIYTERYMRTPQENAAGYDDCPIARVEKLHGALLLCHGMADDNVHFRNTAEYTEAMVQADKDFRQLVYTNRNHSIYGGNTRAHLFRQCVDFFMEKMKSERMKQ